MARGWSFWAFSFLVAGGLFPVAFYAWFHKLGDLAKSPQTVEMNIGTSSLVAGGRAKLWFAMVELGPMVEVTCKGTSRMLELTDEPSDEVCGIRVRAQDVEMVKRGQHEVLRGTFEVTWRDRD